LEVEVLAEAELELDVLPAAERGAILNALEKLRQLGPALGAPIRARSRAARCESYGRGKAGARGGPSTGAGGERLVVASIGPEVRKNRLGFGRAVKAAEERITAFEPTEGGTA